MEAGSEPVAWMVTTADGKHLIFRMTKPAIVEGETIEPLYAAPQPTDRNAVIEECVNAILAKGALEDGGYVAALRALKTQAPAQPAGQDRIDAENAQCPVCGYYCLGNGGIGCIDKPSLVDR